MITVTAPRHRIWPLVSASALFLGALVISSTGFWGSWVGNSNAEHRISKPAVDRSTVEQVFAQEPDQNRPPSPPPVPVTPPKPPRLAAQPVPQPAQSPAALPPREDDLIADLLGDLEQAPEPEPEPQTPSQPSPSQTSPGIDDLLATLASSEDQAARPAPAQPAAPDPTSSEPTAPVPLEALGLPTTLERSADPATVTAPTSSASNQPALATLPAIDQMVVQSAAGAGGGDWNARFPWIRVAPFLVNGAALIPNDNLPPPLVANVQAPDQTAATTGNEAPASFVMRRGDTPAPAPSSTAVVPEAEPAEEVASSSDRLAKQVTDYGRQVSTLISDSIVYPPEFDAEKLAGTVVLGIILTPQGELVQSVVLETSGEPRIDKAAQDLVARLPFPTPPAGASEQQLRYGIPMEFTPPT